MSLIRKEIMLIEIGITNQDILQTVEVEEIRSISHFQLYKRKSKIIPYEMVITYHKKNISKK